MYFFLVILFNLEEAVADDLNWLKFNSQPWTEVLAKWQATSKYRVTQLLVGAKDVDSFKLLLDPKADSLVGYVIKHHM